MSTLDLGNSFHVITFVLVKSDKERSPAGKKKMKAHQFTSLIPSQFSPEDPAGQSHV